MKPKKPKPRRRSLDSIGDQILDLTVEFASRHPVHALACLSSCMSMIVRHDLVWEVVLVAITPNPDEPPTPSINRDRALIEFLAALRDLAKQNASIIPFKITPIGEHDGP